MRTEYPCKILVIEDDAGICRFLRATLTAAHYDVIVTDTGKKAFEIVSSHCPDCILLDLGLPDLDGNDIIQSIRGWTKTPIIVISARSTEEDKARALDLGGRLSHQAFRLHRADGAHPHGAAPHAHDHGKRLHRAERRLYGARAYRRL